MSLSSAFRLLLYASLFRIVLTRYDHSTAPASRCNPPTSASSKTKCSQSIPECGMKTWGDRGQLCTTIQQLPSDIRRSCSSNVLSHPISGGTFPDPSPHHSLSHTNTQVPLPHPTPFSAPTSFSLTVHLRSQTSATPIHVGSNVTLSSHWALAPASGRHLHRWYGLLFPSKDCSFPRGILGPGSKPRLACWRVKES